MPLWPNCPCQVAACPQFVGFVCCFFALPVYTFGPGVASFFRSLRQNRKGTVGTDPEILALPDLDNIRPAKARRPQRPQIPFEFRAYLPRLAPRTMAPPAFRHGSCPRRR